MPLQIDPSIEDNDDKDEDTVFQEIDDTLSSLPSSTPLASPSTYFFLGLVFLVFPTALIVYFGRNGKARKSIAKMLGREGRDGRYEMVGTKDQAQA